jgi:hypothetical protein
MDRFDESTRDRFPADRFLGGLRLLEPGRGRRVAPAGGRRAVFDGPFPRERGRRAGQSGRVVDDRGEEPRV